MTSVLGTPLAVLPADDRPALLVSDLHVPADGGVVLTALAAVLVAAQQRSARVILLGDLFDSYVSPAQIHVGIWREVAQRFAAAVAAGVEIHVLPGNRDFLLGAEFSAASRVQLAAGGLRVRLGGRDTVLLHGDELCQNDLPYQRAKRWLRHPLTRWVARHLPLRQALRVAERARQRSRRVVMTGDQDRFLPTRAAVAAAFATGATQLVFGHIHRHATGPFGSGRYWVLPAFDATSIGLLADTQGLRAVRFLSGGELQPVPPPGECPFPA